MAIYLMLGLKQVRWELQGNMEQSIWARLHQALASTLRQLCDDASDTVFIENNGITRKGVANPFWSDSIAFNDSSITCVS